MKDLDFSWREKGELKTSLTENSHKICKILELEVAQCRGTPVQGSVRASRSWAEVGATVSQASVALGMGVEGTDPQNRDCFGQD